jgi:hypothetical protein
MPIAVQQPKTSCVSKRPVVKISLRAALVEHRTFSTGHSALSSYCVLSITTTYTASLLSYLTVKQNLGQQTKLEAGSTITYTPASLSFHCAAIHCKSRLAGWLADIIGKVRTHHLGLSPCINSSVKVCI